MFYTLADDLSDHQKGPFDCPEADPALDFPSTSASFLVMALMCPSAIFHSGGPGRVDTICGNVCSSLGA